VLEAALFRLHRIPLNARDGALNGVAIEVGEGDAGEGEDGHVAVGQEVNVAGVVEDAGNVGGDERLAFAHADDYGRPGAGGDDFVGLGGGKDTKRKGSGEALDGAADGYFKGDGRAGGFGVILDLFDEVGDDFGVGFSDELVALVDEFVLQVKIVFDDAVVDDDKTAGAVAMGVRVFFCGTAVRGPARVADAEGALDGILAENLFKVGKLALGAADLQAWGSKGCRRRCLPSRNRGIQDAAIPQ
jgi:hypothetical protein